MFAALISTSGFIRWYFFGQKILISEFGKRYCPIWLIRSTQKSKFDKIRGNRGYLIQPWNSLLENDIFFRFSIFRAVTIFSDLFQPIFMIVLLRSLLTLCCALLVIQMALVEYINLNRFQNILLFIHFLAFNCRHFFSLSYIMETIHRSFQY